jgi:hypothetical protein
MVKQLHRIPNELLLFVDETHPTRSAVLPLVVLFWAQARIGKMKINSDKVFVSWCGVAIIEYHMSKLAQMVKGKTLRVRKFIRKVSQGISIISWGIYIPSPWVILLSAIWRSPVIPLSYFPLSPILFPLGPSIFPIFAGTFHLFSIIWDLPIIVREHPSVPWNCGSL